MQDGGGDAGRPSAVRVAVDLNGGAKGKGVQASQWLGELAFGTQLAVMGR